MDRERLYQSALADVRYTFGRPIPFEAKLATRMAKGEKEAWAEAQRRYG